MLICHSSEGGACLNVPEHRVNELTSWVCFQYSALDCTVFCTVHSTALYYVLCPVLHCIFYCALYCTIFCTVQCVHCTSLYTAHCAQCTLLLCIMYCVLHCTSISKVTQKIFCFCMKLCNCVQIFECCE